MALISCPECKKEISDQATSCPHCGFPIAKPKTDEPTLPAQSQQTQTKSSSSKGCLTWIVAGGVVLILLMVIGDISQRSNRSETETTLCDATELTRAIQVFRQEGLLDKIDSNHVYVGGPWYIGTVDQKKGWAYWLVCGAYGGKIPSGAHVIFHDSRSGEQVAEWGALGFRVFK